MKQLTVEDWKRELEKGLEFRSIHGVESDWHQLESLFYGVHGSQANAGPNLILGTGDALISALAVPNRYFSVKPCQPGYVDKAMIHESVLNTLMREMKVSQKCEELVAHTFLYGRGFFKIGYDSEFGYDPTFDIGGAEGEAGMTLTQFDKKGRRIEFLSDVHPGMPWVTPVLPHDIVLPWGVRYLDASPWVAHRVVRHIDDIKKDPKYSNTKDLLPIMSMEDFTSSYSHPMKALSSTPMNTSMRGFKRETDYVELWEIHERRTGRIKVIATGYDKFLRDEVDLLQLEGYPFVSMNFTPISRSFWVTPDSYYLLPHQTEAADIMLQASKQRRVNVLKFIVDGGSMDEEEQEKLIRGDVGAVARTKGGAPLNNVIQPVQAGQNMLLYNDLEHIRRDARELVGFSRNQMGEFDSSTRRTASEAQIVDRAAGQRLGRRVMALNDTLTQLAAKISAIVFEYWRTPSVTLVLGEDGSEQWEQFTGTYLKGKYSYDLTISNERTESKEDRMMRAMQMYQLLAQDPSVDQVGLRRNIVQTANDPQVTRLFKPEIAGVLQRANLQATMQQMLEGQQGVSQNGGQQTAGL